MRLAWISTLNSPCSASSYCSSQLLPFLHSRFDIDLFTPAEEAGPGRFDWRELWPRHKTRRYDLFFYQLEEHARLSFVPQLLHYLPGAVLFHDVLFRDRAFGDGFLHTQSEHGAEEHFAADAAAASLLSFFSCERDLNEWKKRNTQAGRAFFYLPYPVHEQMFSASARPPSGGLSLLYHGSPNIEDRAQHLLPALARLESAYRLSWMLAEDELPRAKELCRLFSIDPARIEWRCPRSWDIWRELLGSGDLACHLYCSAFGDPGPGLPMSMAAGLPCLVNDFGSAQWLPDKTVRKIPGGVEETEAIVRALQDAAAKREEDPYVKAARAYAMEMHDRQSIAAQLSRTLESFAPVLKSAGDDNEQRRCGAIEQFFKEM